MSEGRILTWHKKEGDEVKRGEALAEVATDKADLEIESFHQGKLLKIFAPAGATVKVGSVIAMIGDGAEAVPTQPKQAASQPKQAEKPVQKAQPTPAQQAPIQVAPVEQPKSQAIPQQAPQNGAHAQSAEGRVKISPLARNVAASHGVDYSQVKGTGEGGRIVKRDIEDALGSAPQQAPEAATPQYAQTQAPVQAPLQVRVEQPRSVASSSVSAGSEQLSKMRQAIAARMVEAKTTIPHFYMTSRLHVDALVRMKTTLKPLPQYEGLTINHLILKAVSLALRAVPRVNACYADGSLRQPGEINIGVVTAVTDGLLIPVLKRADELPLSDVVSETRGLVQRARAGKPKADDLVGGTFSVSNVGMFPVEEFAAIISPGQGGILAVSAIQDEPFVIEGQIRPAQVMRVTLSVDHRIIDGVVAGEFLQELKRVIEEPLLLLA
jgi:pyruvate dehydrogenase E2 component (dihydrolipoamide acetyltransferase)